MFIQEPIPQVTRKHYPKSFLYSVAIMLTYDGDDVLDVHSNDIIKFMQNQQWVLSKKDESGMVFEKNTLALVLHEKVVLLSIPKSSYSGFDTLSAEFSDIEEVLKISRAQKIINVFINKINRYLIKKELVKSREWVFSQLFSEQFLKAYEEATGVMALSGSLLTLFNVKESEKGDICAYDFSISVSKVDNRGLGIFTKTAYEINDSMFSAWDWAVSGNVKKMMEG